MAAHPDSPLIDGAMPHTDAERCKILLNYAADVMKELKVESPTKSVLLLHKYEELEREYNHWYLAEDTVEFWHELEDEIIELCNDILPDDVVMLLHPDDPGTIVIWHREELDDGI